MSWFRKKKPPDVPWIRNNMWPVDKVVIRPGVRVFGGRMVLETSTGPLPLPLKDFGVSHYVLQVGDTVEVYWKLVAEA
jgi:hypothetical protein